MREGIDALLTQAFELGATVVPLHHRRERTQRSILVIFSLRAGPRGTCTLTVSPRLWPSSARPTGDSFESLLSAGLASAEPTILNFVDLSVFWSFTWTVTPTLTTSVSTD